MDATTAGAATDDAAAPPASRPVADVRVGDGAAPVDVAAPGAAPGAADDDAALVARAQAGDRAAFSALYARHGRVIHAALLARVPPADAADLLHDVFEVALRRLSSVRDGAAVGGWLGAIARHRSADYWRGRGRFDDEDPEPAVADPPRSEAEQALAAIRRLPEAYRETLILRLVEGMSGAEIAARTGLTAGSVRVNLHRGMKLLRASLGEETDR